MNLTNEELNALKNGRAVRISVPEIGTDCVVLRADVFDQLSTTLAADLDPQQIAALIEQNMSEYDADDPLLDSYQTYRR